MNLAGVFIDSRRPKLDRCFRSGLDVPETINSYRDRGIHLWLLDLGDCGADAVTDRVSNAGIASRHSAKKGLHAVCTRLRRLAAKESEALTRVAYVCAAPFSAGGGGGSSKCNLSPL
jgi:hypothetical protein